MGDQEPATRADRDAALNELPPGADDHPFERWCTIHRPYYPEYERDCPACEADALVEAQVEEADALADDGDDAGA